jgi:hypothetical protein
MNFVRICGSPGHIHLGHLGKPPGTAPMAEVPRARLIAGRGVEGDRHTHGDRAKGRVTFFAEEAWLGLCREPGRAARLNTPPA